MDAPTMQVKSLTKKIGRRTIVDQVSFDVYPGEVFGFLGPNGAGKTTTIRMLVGLVRPTSGTVQIGGYDLKKQFTQAISQVGCIVENPEMYAFLTGRENLEHFAGLLPDAPFDRIEPLSRIVDLHERLEEPVKTYSLGMRQRLGIAQALLGNPRLLILDEPTNGLDPAGIRELRNFIRRLAKEQQLSVLVSSHLLSEVEMLCDRVAIIHQGHIIREASVAALLESDDVQVDWHVNDPERTQNVLRAIAGVASIVHDNSTETIACRMPVDQIGHATTQLVEAGVIVSGVERRRQTLEDLFLKLTDV